MENSTAPYLIIGLGNPGREYRETRHNVGFMVIDALCKSLGISLSRMQSKALVGTGIIGDRKIVLAKPQTFMNISGQAVGGLVHFYKTPLTHLLVAHDDLDLPFGTVRIRPDGGAAGQKGMTSIMQQLSSQEFARLRIGIGRPPGQMDPSAYVLQRFTKEEQDFLQLVLERAEAAVRLFVQDGIQTAMNQSNGSLMEK